MKNNKLLLLLRYLTPLFCLAGIIYLQTSHIKTKQSQTGEDALKEEQSTQVFLNLQKNMPSFGFNNLIADWNFLGFIQYFGDGKAREQTGYSLIPNFFEIMVDRDPRFIQAYLQMSTANSIYSGRPDKTVTFMNRVLESVSPKTFPLSIYIWIYKGVDEILFLGDLKAARHSYQMASNWASIQGNEFMANQTRATAEYLATNPDPRKAQVSAWMTILTTTPDQKTQQYTIDKIKSLGAEISVTPEGKLQVITPSSWE